MSLKLQVYAAELKDNLIGQLLKRLNEQSMVVEVKPGFTFKSEFGELTFKFRLTDSPFASLNGRELTSTIFLETRDFELRKIKATLNPERSLLSKILGIKPPEIFLAGRQIDERLKECNKLLTIGWSSGDIFEFYFASMTSAVLAELTGGESCYPADNIWYDTKSVVAFTLQEWQRYQAAFTDDTVAYNEFEGW